MFDKLAGHSRLLIVVGQPNTIGALLVTVARACGHDAAYLPGLAMRRIADLDPGQAKTDARNADIIADAARTMPHTLRRVDIGEEDPHRTLRRPCSPCSATNSPTGHPQPQQLDEHDEDPQGPRWFVRRRPIRLPATYNRSRAVRHLFGAPDLGSGQFVLPDSRPGAMDGVPRVPEVTAVPRRGRNCS